VKRIQVVFLIFVINLLTATAVFAQVTELTLKLSRDFGYGGFNGDIQGTFSMKVSGPADLVRVVFYLDTKMIGEVTKEPFNLQFNTDNYPLGLHELSAAGYSSNGQEYRSNVIASNFVPASEGSKSALGMMIPVLAIALIAILLSFIVPLITSRGKTQNLPLGAERKYGLSGGICPKCHRPFALPLVSMRLGLTKFARCPYCGKWSMVRVETIGKLREAEKSELGWGKTEVAEESEEEKFRKQIDDSKFQ